MTISLERLLITVVLATFAPGSLQSLPPPFTLTLSAPEYVFKTGSEVKLQVILQNTSSRAIYVSESVGQVQFQYAIDVRDSQGKPAPDTEFGRKMRGPIYSSDTVFQLQPGETLKNDLIVTKLYDMSHPGRYSIQVSREIPSRELGKGTVKSNVITITVTKPDD